MEAEAKIRAADPEDAECVLSMSFLQFGRYRGKSFLWLLQNDVGWAVMVLADHEKTREVGQKKTPHPQWNNKEALYRYLY